MYENNFNWALLLQNGVKQGGVSSRILFGVYINNLLDKLEKLRFGCLIGHIFMGEFGYADDIILLAPSRTIKSAVFKHFCKPP